MKRYKNLFILVLGVFLCVAFFSSTSILAAVEVSITGTVFADDWDDKDNVIAVVIETADGETYNVSDDAKGKELFKLVDKNVKVTGTVVEDIDGEKVITVMAYEVME